MINDKTLEKFKYWSEKELRSPDDVTSWRLVDYNFLQQLTKLRNIYSKPIYPTSVFRTKLHNSNIGGVSNSSHLLGLAADLSVSEGDNKATLQFLQDYKNSRERWKAISTNEVPTTKLLQSIVEAGFNRIGLAETFIHIDSDSTKAPSVVWVYN